MLVIRRGAAIAAAMAIALGTTRIAGAGRESAASPPADVAIRKILADRLEALGGSANGIGIVVGIVEPGGRRIVASGLRGQRDPPVAGDTLFEIGSITKVFTGLLLADMVQRGEVGLDDPVAKHLPAHVTVSRRSGRAITLLDLATHASGLAFMPDDLPAFDDPAGSSYSKSRLYEFLARCDSSTDAGTTWGYSNVGYWLLGEALASRAGTDYESLLLTRVLAPLGLKDTVTTVSQALKSRLAVGHNAALQPAPYVPSIPVYSLMPAAGGLLSTVNDLLAFLSLSLGDRRSPLAPAMTAMLATRRPKEAVREFQAIGWVVIGEGEDQIVFHDGGTMGFASAVAWDPARRVGIVALSNQMSGVSDLARHLLQAGFPLEAPKATKRTEIALDAEVLDTYAGQYEEEDEGIFVVHHEGGGLTIRLPVSWGLPPLRLRPESRRDFFAAELPLRVTFEADGDGRITGMLVQPPRGQHVIATRRIGVVN